MAGRDKLSDAIDGIAPTRRTTPKKRKSEAPKGILGRAAAVVTGAGGALQAPFGLITGAATFDGHPAAAQELLGELDPARREPLLRSGALREPHQSPRGPRASCPATSGATTLPAPRSAYCG